MNFDVKKDMKTDKYIVGQRELKGQTTPKNKTVLVAEDEITNYLFIETVLEDAGYRLLHAWNGKEALDLFASENVDLIIMDLKMPVMDGFEAIEKVREVNISLPIIAHSAYDYYDTRKKALAAGCTAYLPKPVNHEQLIDMVRKVLKMSK